MQENHTNVFSCPLVISSWLTRTCHVYVVVKIRWIIRIEGHVVVSTSFKQSKWLRAATIPSSSCSLCCQVRKSKNADKKRLTYNVRNGLTYLRRAFFWTRSRQTAFLILQNPWVFAWDLSFSPLSFSLELRSILCKPCIFCLKSLWNLEKMIKFYHFSF